MRAHPRVCGENPATGPGQDAQVGSSPRVRGKHLSVVLAVFCRRLIPACAGKTDHRRQPNGHRRAHPRVCGENDPGPPFKRCGVGSSPRVRGKHSWSYRWLHVLGLIPACAGKTPKRELPLFQHPAHPRVCGENSSWWDALSKSAGSSPRVRGKHTKSRSVNKRIGLIPACAGKTIISATA